MGPVLLFQLACATYGMSGRAIPRMIVKIQNSVRIEKTNSTLCLSLSSLALASITLNSKWGEVSSPYHHVVDRDWARPASWPSPRHVLVTKKENDTMRGRRRTSISNCKLKITIIYFTVQLVVMELRLEFYLSKGEFFLIFRTSRCSVMTINVELLSIMRNAYSNVFRKEYYEYNTNIITPVFNYQVEIGNGTNLSEG